MTTGHIQITQILGTDSISSSRIVINDNFKILAHELDNYRQYFDENGIYSSVITSKNVEGTIDFKVDEFNSKMTISGNGVDINGDLDVLGNLNLHGKLINSDVESQTLSNFYITSQNGYIDCYSYGQVIKKETNDNEEIPFSSISNLLYNQSTSLLQYINKPIIIVGYGIYVSYTEADNFANIASTNCKVYDDNNVFYLMPASYTMSTVRSSFNVIKIYPIVFGTETSPEFRLRIEM